MSVTWDLGKKESARCLMVSGRDIVQSITCRNTRPVFSSQINVVQSIAPAASSRPSLSAATHVAAARRPTNVRLRSPVARSSSCTAAPTPAYRHHFVAHAHVTSARSPAGTIRIRLTIWPVPASASATAPFVDTAKKLPKVGLNQSPVKPPDGTPLATRGSRRTRRLGPIGGSCFGGENSSRGMSRKSGGGASRYLWRKAGAD